MMIKNCLMLLIGTRNLLVECVWGDQVMVWSQWKVIGSI